MHEGDRLIPLVAGLNSLILDQLKRNDEEGQTP